jgi:cysteine desulfurase/selenocysteine lyase
VTLDVDALRKREFPWTLAGDSIFLNAASTGPLPQRAVDAVSDWARMRATPQRLKDDALFSTLTKSRELLAAMVRAKPTEIALATNTSYGINLAARALPLAAGDVIVTPDREFPANIYPWMAAAQARGVEHRIVPVPDNGIVEEALEKALQDRKVKCVAVSWVGFAGGYRVDLQRISRACRSAGAYFVVDGIQGLGPCELDLGAVDVDLFACGAQKWLLSPWGSGFVYVRSGLISKLEPHEVSWMAPRGTDDFRRLLDYDLTWREDARRFEFVTLPFQDFAGMNASLGLFKELGYASMAAHTRSLADEIVNWAQTSKGVDLMTPADPARRAGVVSVRPRDAEQASERLRAAGVTHSLREGAIRLAPYIYNTADEIRAALGIIERAP